MANDYSTEKISTSLINEISSSIEGKKYGSVEIFIENGIVTHITERVIHKYKQEKVKTLSSNQDYVNFKPLRRRNG